MYHMCDSVDDEIISLVTEMQTVFRNIVQMNQETDKTNVEQYCKKNKRMIQYILQYAQQEGPKQQEFRNMVSPYIQ